MAATNLADPDASSRSLLIMVKDEASTWDSTLRSYAKYLFTGLALIQIVYTYGRLLFRQAEIADFIGDTIHFFMVMGFFGMLLIFSVEWAQAIVDSFLEAGAHAAGVDPTIEPGQVFGRGVELAFALWNSKSFFTPFDNLGLTLAGVVIVFCFAFLAAFMFVTLVEAAFVIHASVLFMGFGASEWTRDYTMAAIRYCVSVGAKLFTLILLIGIVLNVSSDWLAAYQANDSKVSVLTLIGISFICCYFTKTLPELVQGMLAGTSMGGGGAIGNMAGAATKATAALAGVATAGAALAAVLTKTADSAGGSKNGGDLASSLSDSLGGGNGGPSGGPMGGGGPTDPSGGGSGRSDPVARSLNPRIGGGEPARTSIASNGTSSTSSSPKSSAQVAAEQVKAGKPDNSNPEVNKAMDNLIKSTSSALKTTAGSLAALSVPGLEGAAVSHSMPSLSAGKEDDTAYKDTIVNPVSDSGNESENVIRPASVTEQTTSRSIDSLQVPGVTVNKDKGDSA
ncbi:P-type conjugative transfer protein TrbL [Acinetobacter baumannii]|nr:P-type conjugative transfer protein TrbL [Acinetobacter baumannii]